MSEFQSSIKDSALTMQSPEGIEFVLYPAGLVIRACAWAIDSFIQGIILIAIIIGGSALSWALGIWLILILAFLLDWFYHVVFEVFFGGQSPGKRIMGIRVLRGNGSPVDPGSSFLRNLLRFADTFLFLYLIALICMLTSSGFRRLGDWAADTLVVYTDSARSPGSSPASRRSSMPWLNDFPMLSPPRKLSYEEKQAVLSFARRYPLLGKARSDEIAKVWVDALEDETLENDASEASASAYILGIAHALDRGGSSIPAGREQAS
ncbi:MAG: RDD family protein [Treponema sp.]|nr:RDD family protein [Treponema sp.]